ncbi:MAG: hypothetical protein IT514_07315, partial [Burkholderiales bacterium]|nr:hypothetical protein [Burkholderiales bacterium]
TFIVEADGYAWAAHMKRLLQHSCARVSKRKSKKLNRREYANLQKRYRHILTRGQSELPPIPARQNGKRGRIAKSDAHNLWERLKQHETAVLGCACLPQHASPLPGNAAGESRRVLAPGARGRLAYPGTPSRT